VSREQGLRIINIGSGCNKWPFPNLVDYTASKGGIEMLTKVAAVELGPYRIRVNCVAPGAIEIERTKAELVDYAGTWSKLTPLGRIGTPRNLGKAVVFFASEDADFITGQTIWVDGGLFTRPVWPHQRLRRSSGLSH
jgi:NAD(P)-dependent dehydrogenase (short-subunit alcohol dehydrogenase family)